MSPSAVVEEIILRPQLEFIMADPAFIPYEAYSFSREEMKKRAHALFEFMDIERTVRDFSDRPIPNEILEQIIRVRIQHRRVLISNLGLLYGYRSFNKTED